MNVNIGQCRAGKDMACACACGNHADDLLNYTLNDFFLCVVHCDKLCEHQYTYNALRYAQQKKIAEITFDRMINLQNLFTALSHRVHKLLFYYDYC